MSPVCSVTYVAGLHPRWSGHGAATSRVVRPYFSASGSVPLNKNPFRGLQLRDV